ncbi:MAG: response regulator [Campylobacter sp.]|uniref:Receiver domain protein n=1 Tax=Campylobacter vicugnae TaxID=1660076 RepID=A0A1X9T3N9_9BACT|nr:MULTISPECIES: response regulator [Campylobacter]MBR2149308.1 response regulator [Campylobacter sp.]ARR03120.1 receiver domain protein [Campylobacter sp. RM8964]MBR2158523.1 response regulator [Campylobacter sp.]MBR2163586.1 response regulator [Campylobacter sp.]MBR2222288.1 response regulator [Campylobacter sp.]
MRVLIVENEIYLAQSIASKLVEFGYSCEIATHIFEALRDDRYDVVLLSTSFNSNEFYKVIENHKNSIIILLISYISSDTVSNPMKAGVSDYIQKPFMIEELVRKIKFFESFKRYEMLNETYSIMLESAMIINKPASLDHKKIKLPLIIHSSKIQISDGFVFSYAKESGLNCKIVDAKLGFDIKALLPNSFIYIRNIDELSLDARANMLDSLRGTPTIVHSASDHIGFNFMMLGEPRAAMMSDILSIDEYVKQMILLYQDILPDTEISKKLGISRKSIWERRKRHDIYRQK